MGVDINWAFQREDKAGNWASIPSNFSGDRSYFFFSWLGYDPRRTSTSTTNPIHALRGLPKDIAADNEDMYGQHSFSWLTATEILSATLPDDPGEIVLEFVEEVKRLQAEYGNIRFVFGFEG